MINQETMMAVGSNCSGYEPTNSGFSSAIVQPDLISCTNCSNLIDDKCQKNLFDRVLARIDER